MTKDELIRLIDEHASVYLGFESRGYGLRKYRKAELVRIEAAYARMADLARQANALEPDVSNTVKIAWDMSDTGPPEYKTAWELRKQAADIWRQGTDQLAKE